MQLQAMLNKGDSDPSRGIGVLTNPAFARRK